METRNAQGVNAADLYKAGYSIPQIARLLQIPYDKVFDALEEAELIIRSVVFGGNGTEGVR
mgnify:CR=1 FL=1